MATVHECSTCHYFRRGETDGSVGQCWRYPVPALVAPKRWCGEFYDQDEWDEIEEMRVLLDDEQRRAEDAA